MVNVAGGNLSIAHGLKGPNTIATACASATNAMGGLEACGRTDLVITGGTEAAITKMGWRQNMKLSTPMTTKLCKPTF